MTWWMVLLLIFGILFLIGCIPVGVDAAYLGGSFTLKVKIWLLRLQILPAKPKKPKMEKASDAKDGKKPAGGKDKAPAAKEAQTADGAVLRSVSGVIPGDEVRVTLSDGALECGVLKCHERKDD